MSPAIRGMLLAILATLIWSGNFIVARGIASQAAPVSIGFLRWLCASLIILPIGFQSVKANWSLIKANWLLIITAAIFGISLFNTLIYVAGHFSTALNLALIGTTSSPVFSFILAAIFLKEKIPLLRILGLILCICGIVFIVCQGSLERLLQLSLTAGDSWTLLSALSFAIYNICNRKKPAQLPAPAWLCATFVTGTILLLPFFMYENRQSIQFPVTYNFLFIVVYLGLGASVISFYCWNGAVQRLGAARAAIFGNLIPLFTSIEAIVLLNEKMQPYHWAGIVLLCCGLFLANITAFRPAGRAQKKRLIKA